MIGSRSPSFIHSINLIEFDFEFKLCIWLLFDLLSHFSFSLSLSHYRLSPQIMCTTCNIIESLSHSLACSPSLLFAHVLTYISFKAYLSGLSSDMSTAWYYLAILYCVRTPKTKVTAIRHSDQSTGSNYCRAVSFRRIIRESRYDEYALTRVNRLHCHHTYDLCDLSPTGRTFEAFSLARS